MEKRRSFLPIFFLFLFLSLVVFFLSSHKLLFGQNLLEDALFPIQSGIFKIVRLPGNVFQNTSLSELQKENISLHKQLVNLQEIQTEDKALHDQFETSSVVSNNLLPANVIGDPQFIPGVNAPEVLILDQGKSSGVKIGQAVVYEQNVIGIISQVTDHTSLVTLVSNTITSFTAKTSTTNAQGVMTGQGNGVMVLGSVLLSDALHVGDTIVTTGSENLQGQGLPPGFIVGKILSVSKTPSSLYQSASVKSLLTVEKLNTVFIMTGQ